MTDLSTPSVYERQEQLLRFLQEKQRITIDEVCEKFDISRATARRDLDFLAEQDKLERIRGGAVLRRRVSPESPVVLRMTQLAEEKKRIGQAASRLVRDGETIFLGSGTTVLEVAKHLHSHKGLTILTNSFLILGEFLNSHDVTVVTLGGVMRQNELSFIGHITEKSLSEVRADKVIMGMRSIDPYEGLTSHDLNETTTDRALLNIGREVILVADHSKCGRVSAAFVASIRSIHTLITDTAVSADFVQQMRDQEIRVILA
jgi:DeoR/GlpR family transcriptional regulator of sugar metabolism